MEQNHNPYNSIGITFFTVVAFNSCVEETSTLSKTCWKCRDNDERKKHTIVGWDDGGKNM